MMKPGKLLWIAALFALATGALSGCKSTESDTTVGAGAYYGTGFHDPWYHYDYYYPPDVIVTPPPTTPPTEPPPRPAQPIYNPPPPRPTPMPSVPMRPRVR